MITDPIQFANSSKGDTWLLSTAEDTGAEIVIHRANQRSGRHEARTLVPAFLDPRPLGPEHEASVALLKLRTKSETRSPVW